MRKLFSYLAVFVTTASGSILGFNALQGDETPEKNAVYLTLVSDILHEDREVIIRLPRLYDSTKRYPVVYALDGTSFDRPIAEKLEILFNAGVSPEAIVVGIPNMTSRNRGINLTPPFMRIDHEDPGSPKGEADQFLEFLEKELIPFVEKKYPSSSRAFCGNSKGGLTVMYSLIRKPNLFESRFCFSTPFWRENNVLIDSVENFMRTDSLHSFIYLNAGDAETDNIKGGHKRITNVLSKKPGITLHSTYTPQAVHGNNALIAAPDGLARWGVFIRSK